MEVYAHKGLLIYNIYIQYCVGDNKSNVLRLLIKVNYMYMYT